MKKLIKHIVTLALMAVYLAWAALLLGGLASIIYNSFILGYLTVYSWF